MTKEQIVQGYLMNSPKVVAEMLYETIERYELKIKKYEEIINWFEQCDILMEQNSNTSLRNYNR